MYLKGDNVSDSSVGKVPGIVYMIVEGIVSIPHTSNMYKRYWHLLKVEHVKIALYVA